MLRTSTTGPTYQPAPVTPQPRRYGDLGPSRSPNSSGPTRSFVMRPLGSFKKGGHVNKTGIYKLHEGEEVIPKGPVSKALEKVKQGKKK